MLNFKTFAVPDKQNVSFFITFFPLCIYLIYYFIKKKGKTVDIEFMGIYKSAEFTDLAIKSSEEFDDLKSEINTFVNNYI